MCVYDKKLPVVSLYSSLKPGYYDDDDDDNHLDDCTGLLYAGNSLSHSNRVNKPISKPPIIIVVIIISKKAVPVR